MNVDSSVIDWGKRFQDLATDAGQMYARSLRRYNELLERVARGELKPDEVQRQFRQYFEERATTSTRELVELSVTLLTGLLHVEARYRDGLLNGLLPPDAPAAPPLAAANIDLTNWFQSLATYAAEQSARGMARHQQLVEKISSGEISSARVQEHGRRFLEDQAPQLLGDVMELGLDFVARLQHSSASLADGLYDRVLGAEAQADSHPDTPICVDLRGPLGATASACIVVENTRSVPAEVACRVSPFAPRSGGERFQPVLEIEPSRFTLPPGGQHDVDVRLTLDQTRFAPGTDYAATMLIAGVGERELIVQLMARAEAPMPEAPRPKPVAAATSRRTAGRARKKRR